MDSLAICWRVVWLNLTQSWMCRDHLHALHPLFHPYIVHIDPWRQVLPLLANTGPREPKACLYSSFLLVSQLRWFTSWLTEHTWFRKSASRKPWKQGELGLLSITVGHLWSKTSKRDQETRTHSDLQHNQFSPLWCSVRNYCRKQQWATLELFLLSLAQGSETRTHLQPPSGYYCQKCNVY